MFGLVLIGVLLGAVASILTQIILARSLPVSDFGTLTTLMGGLVIVSSMASFGSASLWHRVFGEEGSSALRWIGPSLSIVAFVSLTVVSLFAFLIANYSRHLPLSSYLYFLIPLFLAQILWELVSAKFQLCAEKIKLSLWQLFPHTTRLIATGLVVIITWPDLPDIFLILFVFAAPALLTISYSIYELRLLVSGRFILYGESNVLNDLRNSFAAEPQRSVVLTRMYPFAIQNFLFMLISQGPTVVIYYLLGGEQAAFYSAALLFIYVACLLPSTFYQRSVTSEMHRWAYVNPTNFRDFYISGAKGMIILGLTIMVLLLIIGGELVEFIFGPSYSYSVIILSVIVFALPFRFLVFHYGAILSTRDHISSKVQLMTIGAVIQLSVLLILTELYGLLGSAVSFVITELSVCWLYFRHLKTLKLVY